MYKKYFSFRERPFKLVPNPEYYYLSRSHEEAMAHLSYAISEGDGFVEITGEVGTGKTTLCRVFLENLDERTEVAYIFNPRLGPKQLLKTIADELGIRCSSDDIKDLIDALNLYLIKMKTKERRVVLLVDEAQNLSRNVLEQLRLLSNLETNRSKLLQIILVGQPELGDLLDSYDLRQLAQRITLSCHLSPLTLREAREYIEHRILIASYKTQVPFSGSAIRRIYRYSKGVPRLINIVCDRSLLTAFSRNRKKITGGIVSAAIRELDSGRTAARRKKKGFKLPLTVIAIVSVSVMMIWFYKQGTAGTQQLVKRFIGLAHSSTPRQDKIIEGAGVHIQKLTATKSSRIIQQSSEIHLLSEFLEDMDVKSARLFAIQAVLELWIDEVALDPSLHDETMDDIFFQKAAEQNGFSMLRTGCDLRLLNSLNLPAIIAIKRSRGSSPGFLNLQAIDEHEVTLGRKGKNAVITVPKKVLTANCTGAVYIPWRNQLGDDDLVPGDPPEDSVMMLKRHLRGIGYTQVSLSPFYDEQTEWAVQDLQEKNGLAPDGIVGPLTKILIINESPNEQIPHIRHQIVAQ
jgi:general secretion pathway protein A